MEAAKSSEMVVSYHITTQCHSPQDLELSNLYSVHISPDSLGLP